MIDQGASEIAAPNAAEVGSESVDRFEQQTTRFAQAMKNIGGKVVDTAHQFGSKVTTAAKGMAYDAGRIGEQITKKPKMFATTLLIFGPPLLSACGSQDAAGAEVAIQLLQAMQEHQGPFLQEIAFDPNSNMGGKGEIIRLFPGVDWDATTSYIDTLNDPTNILVHDTDPTGNVLAQDIMQISKTAAELVASGEEISVYIEGVDGQFHLIKLKPNLRQAERIHMVLLPTGAYNAASFVPSSIPNEVTTMDGEFFEPGQSDVFIMVRPNVAVPASEQNNHTDIPSPESAARGIQTGLYHALIEYDLVDMSERELEALGISLTTVADAAGNSLVDGGNGGGKVPNPLTGRETNWVGVPIESPSYLRALENIGPIVSYESTNSQSIGTGGAMPEMSSLGLSEANTRGYQQINVDTIGSLYEDVDRHTQDYLGYSTLVTLHSTGKHIFFSGSNGIGARALEAVDWMYANEPDLLPSELWDLFTYQAHGNISVVVGSSEDMAQHVASAREQGASVLEVHVENKTGEDGRVLSLIHGDDDRGTEFAECDNWEYSERANWRPIVSNQANQ